MNDIQILRILSQSITKACNYIVSKADFDKTYVGFIKEVIGAGKYKVIVNAGEYPISESAVYAAGDYVWVRIPRNDWSKMYIERKK